MSWFTVAAVTTPIGFGHHTRVGGNGLQFYCCYDRSVAVSAERPGLARSSRTSDYPTSDSAGTAGGTIDPSLSSDPPCTDAPDKQNGYTVTGSPVLVW